MFTLTGPTSAVNNALQRESGLSRRRLLSGAMYGACGVATLSIILLLVLVGGYLFVLGLPGLRWSLFTQDVTGDPQTPGGLRHAIVGSTILIGLASIVGVPLGVLAGVFLSEYATHAGITARGWRSLAGRHLARPVRFASDVLAGVPSIVVGILGYELVVVPMKSNSGWAGAVALGFIMVPIVARTTEEMLRLVPGTYRAASLALGATPAQTIVRVVLPAATGSLVTGIMLAVARVAGETAPLLFTAAGNRSLTLNPSQPFPSLTVQIYQYVTGPYQAQKQVGWAGILVLIMMLLVLNACIRAAAARAVRRRHA